MTRKRKELSMDKIRELVRLCSVGGLSTRAIGSSCSISHVTVSRYMKRIEEGDVKASDLLALDDWGLQEFFKPGKTTWNKNRPLPDWNYIHTELKKKSVTLNLLWEEYKELYPNGYQSTQFYDRYYQWRNKLKVSLRQTYKFGEKLFVDYAGQTVPIHFPSCKEVKQAEIFVCVLGASNYTYAEATWSQGLSDWLNSHVRAFEFFGGVPEIVVPDNLKSGVSKACRYEPELNPSYRDMAAHYGVTVIPARVRKPQDKAKVETAVQIVERWILASLRNHTFFSLAEVNESISLALDRLNKRTFQKLEGSRLQVFESHEKSTLKPLPAVAYSFSRWKKAKVNIDYHIELEGHYYSVPYQLVRETVELRYTEITVEIFHKRKRIASHLLSPRRGHHTTVKEHMPKAHRQYQDWSPSRILNWAGGIGENTKTVIETILNNRQHPEQGYRSSFGVLRLAKSFSEERLEKACKRAVAINACYFKSVRSILEKGLDMQPLQKNENTPDTIHQNIRGKEFFTK